MTKTKKSIKIVGSLIILFILTTLAFLVFEFALRPNPEFGRVGYQFDKDLIWRQNKRLTAQKHYAQGKVAGKEPFTLKFNKRGFRGKNFPKKKSKDVKRIMILGDSYTAGLDYPYDEIFTTLLETQLNQEDQKYEVMNVSCPAWGTDQHYAYWIKEGIKYQPDYLIIMMSPNDMREMYNKKLIHFDNNNLRLQQADLPWKEKWGWYLACRFSLFQYLQKKVLKTDYGNFFKIFHYYPVNYGKKDSTDWDAPIFLKEPFKEVEETYVLFEKILNEIIASGNKIGAKLLLCKLPIKVEFDGSYETEEHAPEKITEMIEQVAKRNQIPLLNLNQILKKEADPLHVFMSWEYHYNKAGHDFVGKHLFPFFKEHE